MTKRQNQVLKAILDLTESKGYPPTVREVGQRVGLSSSSTVHAHLNNLRRMGLVEWEPTLIRTLRVL